MTPLDVEKAVVGGRVALKGDNNFCHIDGNDKRHRYQLFKITDEELPEIVESLNAVDTIIWRYDPAVQIEKNYEIDKEVIRLRFAALKDGKQVLICEHKENAYG